MSGTYRIYRIVSPSGKSYIGMTKRTVAERWYEHVISSRNPSNKRPFARAIRHYGADAFTISVLMDGLSEANAGIAEPLFIEAYNSRNRAHGYNVTEGGEYGMNDMNKAWWASVREDPVALAEFGQKISKTKLADSDRIADITRGLWAARSADEIRDIAAKIGASQKAHWDSLDAEQRAAKEAQVARARSKIDKKKQGAAASAGVKAWWAELRSDPARYAEHIARRKASLLKTLEEKKNDQG